MTNEDDVICYNASSLSTTISTTTTAAPLHRHSLPGPLPTPSTAPAPLPTPSTALTAVNTNAVGGLHHHLQLSPALPLYHQHDHPPPASSGPWMYGVYSCIFSTASVLVLWRHGVYSCVCANCGTYGHGGLDCWYMPALGAFFVYFCHFLRSIL